MKSWIVPIILGASFNNSIIGQDIPPHVLMLVNMTILQQNAVSNIFYEEAPKLKSDDNSMRKMKKELKRQCNSKQKRSNHTKKPMRLKRDGR